MQYIINYRKRSYQQIIIGCFGNFDEKSKIINIISQKKNNEKTITSNDAKTISMIKCYGKYESHNYYKTYSKIKFDKDGIKYYKYGEYISKGHDLFGYYFVMTDNNLLENISNEVIDKIENILHNHYCNKISPIETTEYLIKLLCENIYDIGHCYSVTLLIGFIPTISSDISDLKNEIAEII